MLLKESFNHAAKVYNQVRPSYPKAVIDFIIEKTNIASDHFILEIAPGTGQATMSFAERGYKIHCVELGEELARILKEKTQHHDVTVEVGDFDLWEPTIKSADMILCATAFHWLNPKIAFEKCASLLSQDGKLVLMWHVMSTENPIVKEAYDILFSYYPKRKRKADIKAFRRQQIDDSGYFKVKDYLDYEWAEIETREKYIQGFFTQSSYLALDEKQQLEVREKILNVLNKLEKEVTTEVSTTVYIGGKDE